MHPLTASDHGIDINLTARTPAHAADRPHTPSALTVRVRLVENQRRRDDSFVEIGSGLRQANSQQKTRATPQPSPNIQILIEEYD